MDVTNTATVTVPATATDICESGGIIDLTTLVSASPVGGTFTFTGTGVTGNNFDPSGLNGAVSITVDYSLGGCIAGSTTLELNVINNASITVPVAITEVCQGTGTLLLSNLVTVTPIGGIITYTGAGITGGVFDPTGLTGLNTITVDYVSGGCVATQQSFDIQVYDASDPRCTGGIGCAAFTTINEVGGATILPTCVNPENGSITYEITGGSGTYNVTLIDINDASYTRFNQESDGDVTVSNLRSSTYFVIVEDVITTNLCDGRTTTPPRTVTIGIETTVTANTVVGSEVGVVCFGDATGSVEVENLIGSSTGEYHYSINGGVWTQIQTNIIPNAGDANGLTAGTNSIRIGEMVDDPCPQELSVNLGSSNPSIDIVVDPSNITAATCNAADGSIQINAVTGGSGTFTSFVLGGITRSSLPATYSDLVLGMYQFVVTDDAGCTASIDIEVEGADQVATTVTPIDADCSSLETPNGSIVVDVGVIPSGLTYTIQLSLGGDPIESVDVTSPDTGHAFQNLGGGSYELTTSTSDDMCPLVESVVVGGISPVSFEYELICISSNERSLRLFNISGQAGNNDFTLTLIDVRSNGQTIIPRSLVPGTDEITISNEPILDTNLEYVVRLEQNQGLCSPRFDAPDNLFLPSEISASETNTTSSLPDQFTGSMIVGNFIGGYQSDNNAFPYLIRIDLDSAAIPGQQFMTEFDTVRLNSQTLQFEQVYENIPAGRYLVEVVDHLGCGLNFVVRVSLNTDIFIPNIFTPNGDSFNETFFIRNLPEEGSTLIVSNRWGKQVFSSSSYQNNWDGGEEAEGIYFYSLSIAGGSTFSGWVEVLRGSR